MRLTSAMRYGAAVTIIAGLAALTLTHETPASEVQVNPFQNGESGFVVGSFGYALSRDASETGACPQGMSTGYQHVGDLFAANPGTPADQAALTLENGIGRALALQSTTPSLCQSPELGQPDPNWRIVRGGANVEAEGINLDGQVGRANGRAAPGTCAHDNFVGRNGERGIDNQFFRVVGCSTSFQSTGASNGFQNSMRVGEWGILITLKGVDDMRNDPEIEVGLYANGDPIQLSPQREPLANATYAMDQDPRFQATTRGRIVNGVVESDPVDARFHMVINNIRLERPLRDARIRATFRPDGGLDGYLAGYTPVEDMYNLQFGFRNGRVGGGQVAPTRLSALSSVGYAITQGFTCNGAYYALQQNADGHRDPETGRCSSISTQYRFSAMPAFVVNTQTRSVNSDLDQTNRDQYLQDPSARPRQ